MAFGGFMMNDKEESRILEMDEYKTTGEERYKQKIST